MSEIFDGMHTSVLLVHVEKRMLMINQFSRLATGITFVETN